MSETPAHKFAELLEGGPAGPGQPPPSQTLSRFWSRADGNLHVQWYRAESQVDFAPHTHSEFNIVVGLEGAVETRQLGAIETVEGGEAMMGSNPGILHSSRYLTSGRGCEAVSMTFSPEFAQELFGLPKLPQAQQLAYLGKVNSSIIAKSAREIVDEMKTRAFAHETIIEGLATRILVESFRLWPSYGRQMVEADLTPRLARRDHIRAFEFMRWCRKDAFRIEHLCRYLGTSEERFNRLFRTATSDSPASFYNRLLLGQGRDLLADRSLSVKEISYQLGFKTPSHFVVTFRRQFGRTPQEYRLNRGKA